MKQLETPRLILRKFKKSDVDDLFEIISNKNVAHSSDFNTLTTKEICYELIEGAIKDFGTYESFWAMECKENHKVIGYINIENTSLKNKQTSIWWGVSEQYWGLKYTQEALRALIKYLFEEHPFNIIIVKYYSDSARVSTILEDVGMKRDAVLRYRRINPITGEKDPLIVYSILKEEMDW